MSKHQHEQPPAYESIPLDEPSAPPCIPHGDQPSPAGFVCPKPSVGTAYTGTPQSGPGAQQPHNIIAPQPNVIYVQPTAVAPVGPLPSIPTLVTCPTCREMITTRVEYMPNMQTHLIALLCCAFGCWLCCCLPYCIDSCQAANHHCPRCGCFIGQGNIK